MSDKSDDAAMAPIEFPGRYDVPGLKERRYLWTARLFGTVALASIMGNVALSGALITMMPLKEIRPYLVSFSEGSGVVATIRPLTKEVDGFEELTKNLVREYVMMRNSIVRSDAEMQRRWIEDNSYLVLTTEQKAYLSFLNTVSPVFEQLRKDDVTREVTKIHSVVTLAPGRLYQVEFTLIERNAADQITNSQVWTATLEIQFRTQNLTPEGATVNPTGFTVLSYTLAQKVQ